MNLTVRCEHVEVETVLAELNAFVREEFGLETQLIMFLEAVAVLHARRLVGGVAGLVPGWERLSDGWCEPQSSDGWLGERDAEVLASALSPRHEDLPPSNHALAVNKRVLPSIIIKLFLC